MGAGGDFGDDTAEGGVQRCLPVHDGGEDFRLAATLTHHGGGGVIAAAFDAEDGEGSGHGSVRLRLCLMQVTLLHVTLACRLNNGAKGMFEMSAALPILLVTRPEPAARRFLEAVRAAGAVPFRPVMAPVMEIRPVPAEVESGDLTGIILTSAHGAEAANRVGLPRGLTAWCVGDRTADVARDAGFSPISADGDADDLIALILSQAPIGPLLHLRGAHVRGDVAGRLNAAGRISREVVVYDQVEIPLAPEAMAVLMGDVPVALPLFSPRSGTILHDAGPFRAPLHVLAISPAVATAVKGLGMQSIWVADAPTGADMVAGTVAMLAALATVTHRLEADRKPG